MALSMFPAPIRTAILEAVGLKEEGDQTSEVTSGSEAGSNYLGVVQRITLGGKSLIIKTPPENELRRQMFFSDLLFQNEANFYNILLPNLEPLTAAPIVTPKCFLATQELLVMDNLCLEGFRTTTRGVCDYTLARLIVRGMAAFHASSMANPAILRLAKDNLVEVLYNDKQISIRAMWKKMSILDLIRKKLGEDSEVEMKFKPIFENAFERLQKLCSPEIAEPYVALCQGDMWTNNMMFIFNKNEDPISLALFDFQTSRVASPITDLAYFIYICTDSTLRKEHLKSLLHEYYSSLVAQIEEYHLDPDKVFPESAYQDHLKRFSLFGVLSGVMMIPLLLNDGPPVDFDTIAKLPDDQKPAMYISKAAEHRIIEMLQEFVQSEYL